MQSILSNLKKTNRFHLNRSEVGVDGLVSILHFRITIAFLTVCLGLVTFTEYFGEPIQCLMDENGDDAFVPDAVINTYCFVQSTYTILDPKSGYDVKRKIAEAHPGVRPNYYFSKNNFAVEGLARKHAYYQWVPYVLLLQILLFYIPHYIWTEIENGAVGNIFAALPEEGSIMTDKGKFFARKTAKYFYRTLGIHKTLALAWMMNDVLNLANVVGNIFLYNALFGGLFFNYGYEVGRYLSNSPSSEGTRDPFNEVFPKVTKCDFRMYGPSGTIQKFDSLCILSINVINEKIFAFLWYWFAILIIVTAIGVFFKFAFLLGVKCFRRLAMNCLLNNFVIKRMLGDENPNHVRMLFTELGFSDLIFLHLLTQNMSILIFKQFLHNLVQVYQRSLYNRMILKDIDEGDEENETSV